MFFPGRNESGSANAAKMVCFGCPVMMQCREYASRTGTSHGIWGGKYIDE